MIRSNWRSLLRSVAVAGTLLACGGASIEASTVPIEAAKSAEAPKGAVVDGTGAQIELEDSWSKGPAVLVFYLGHW